MNKVNIFGSVRKIECVSFNSAVAQNKEHLLDMLKRQSESALYNLIKFYTVKIQNMQKNMQYIYKYAKCSKMCENMQKCKKNNMQIFKCF